MCSIVEQLPGELKERVLSFVWPQCKCCYIYDDLILYSMCTSCYIKNGYNTILEINKKYRSRYQLLDTQAYEFMGEPTIETEFLSEIGPGPLRLGTWVHTQFNALGMLICRKVLGHEHLSYYPGYLTALHSFAVNIPIEYIHSIDIEIGGQRIDCIYGHLFDVLYDIYDIPKVNENGYTIIPFYVSRAGVEILQYHSMCINIVYNTYEFETKMVYLQYCKQYAKYDRSNRNMDTYQLQYERNYLNNNYRLSFVQHLLYIIVNDQDPELELCINGTYNLLLYRKKHYKNCTLFSFVGHLKDSDFFINASFIDNIVVKKKVTEGLRISAINYQQLRTMGGMLGVRWSR